MNLIGTIHFPSKLNDGQWAAIIAKHAELTSVPSIDVMNPITREPDTISAVGQCAQVNIGGKLGALRWCKYGRGIDVFGESVVLQPLVDRLVAELSGSYEPMPTYD